MQECFWLISSFSIEKFCYLVLQKKCFQNLIAGPETRTFCPDKERRQMWRHIHWSVVHETIFSCWTINRTKVEHICVLPFFFLQGLDNFLHCGYHWSIWGIHRLFCLCPSAHPLVSRAVPIPVQSFSLVASLGCLEVDLGETDLTSSQAAGFIWVQRMM